MDRSHHLWVVIRLPHFALESIVNRAEHSAAKPVVLHHKQRIYLANEFALRYGIQLQMSTTQARALIPELHCILRDEKKERAMFNDLYAQFYAITPHIHPIVLPQQRVAEYAFGLEVSSCLQLFHGWPALLDKIQHALSQLPYQSIIACAHSWEAAWLLTWSTQHSPIHLDQSTWLAHINQLSIRYLLPFPKAIEKLHSIGFANLGDLWRQIELKQHDTSFAALRKRFGREFSHYLQQVFCPPKHAAKPHFQPEEFFSDYLEFEYPANNVEWVLHACEPLLQRLSLFLQKKQKQTQHILWHLHGLDHKKKTIHIHTHSASSQWPLLLELSRIHFEQQELPFAVDMLELECNQLHGLNKKVTDLFGPQDATTNEESLEKLNTKIASRLGQTCVYTLSALDEHLPEKTQQKKMPLEPTKPFNTPVYTLRPTWLFDPPNAIQHKNSRLYWHGYLNIVHGPERITGQWWEKPEERDYFLALREDFIRCWIFYERMGKVWYLQGVFS